jgi:hypothetical protein
VDVVGHVGEVVAHAHDTAIVRDDAAAVTVDQTKDELLGGLIDEHLLPGFEGYPPIVFSAGAMLRQETWPVFRVQGYLNAPFQTLHRRALALHQHVDGLATSIDNCGILLVQDDPQFPHAEVA